ncbi:alkaline phosphatase family protein [Pedobacter sp.]|uniref:alkaline phosphatase family protein n=1 Tax=Pedobacter sp. TaxID=1411316 RepID=UPI0031DAC101
MERTQKNKTNKYGTWYGILFILAICGLSACNKDFEGKRDFAKTQDTVLDVRTSKILYVIIDGARGKSVETSMAPNLTKIKANANYAYESVSDDSGLDATTWTDMLTGVNKAKHGVTSANFAGKQLTNYPMFFKRIKDNSTLRTAAFCASARLSQNLVSDADVNQSFNDDDLAVKTATVDELKRDDAAVVLTEFNSVDKAGAQYGYDNSVAQYQNAILKIDGYIGEIMAQLKSRKNYTNENWLVIIASNQGGAYPVNPADNDGTLFSKPLLNSYVMFYNPAFNISVYEKPNTSAIPYSGNNIKLNGTALRGTLSAADASIFNFGTGVTAPEYTVEFKLKVHAFGTLNAPIFSKSSSPANSSTGWWIIHNGSNGTWRFAGLSSTTITSASAPLLTVGKWYTIGFKIYNESAKRWVVLYQDGEKISNPVDVTSRNVDNAVPLIAGQIDGYGNTATQSITDIRLFKAAVPDNIIKEYACQVNVPTTHPYYNSLIGYWPATDGTGVSFVDKISGTRNFTIGGSPVWESFEDTDAKFCIPFSPEIYNKLPRGVDIPRYIYSWLKIKTDNYGLDGKVWLPVYNITQ